MACCPKTWWCTPAGLVGVEADENGVYTRPEGATSGPYATEEEGFAECRGEWLPACEEVCTYEYRSFYIVSWENATGEMLETSLSMPFGTGYPGPCDGITYVGLFPSNHTGTGGYLVGSVVYFTVIVASGEIQVTVSLWAQNQDLHDHFLKWVDIPAGYVQWGTPYPWPFVMNHIQTDPHLACGVRLFEERTYLGRIAMFNHAETVNYGEVDVYIQ